MTNFTCKISMNINRIESCALTIGNTSSHSLTGNYSATKVVFPLSLLFSSDRKSTTDVCATVISLNCV